MSKTAIHSVTVFNGVSVLPNSTVIFDRISGLIETVSITTQMPSSSDYEVVIDGTGHTLIPGLIDAHVHVHDLHVAKGQNNNDVLKQALRAGVTTVYDMHTEPGTVQMLRDQVE